MWTQGWFPYAQHPKDILNSLQVSVALGFWWFSFYLNICLLRLQPWILAEIPKILIFFKGLIYSQRTHHVRWVSTLWKGQLWIWSSNTHRKETEKLGFGVGKTSKMTIRQYLRFVVVGVFFYGFFLPWDENHHVSPPFGSEYVLDFFAGIVAMQI